MSDVIVCHAACVRMLPGRNSEYRSRADYYLQVRKQPQTNKARPLRKKKCEMQDLHSLLLTPKTLDSFSDAGPGEAELQQTKSSRSSDGQHYHTRWTQLQTKEAAPHYDEQKVYMRESCSG